jgi:D-3-phosphoglycerate dehydrogenase
MKLASQLGRLAGQTTESAIKKISIEYIGGASKVNSRPLTACVLADLLGVMSDSVNMVNAPEIAKAKKIVVSENKIESEGDLQAAIRVTVEAEDATRSVTGTLFAGKEPRVVNIEGVPIEGALTSHMLFIRNEDKPGMIGGLGTILADAGQNIADFRLGRVGAGQTAVALVSLDAPLADAVFEKVSALPQIKQVKRLSF